MKRKNDEPSEHPLSKRIYSSGPYRGYHGCRKGEREEMEDAFVLIDNVSAEPPLPDCITAAAFYAVYDGHCGARAAAYAAERLHPALLEKIPRCPDQGGMESQLKRWFVEAYKTVDEEFLKEASKAKPVWKDGTTATTLLILNRNLFSANVGDSKAFLARWKEAESKLVPIPLTKDHSPIAYEERMRIQKVGVNVIDGRVLGQLEVSRSIGDGQYKSHGVISTPDLRKCSLTPNDRYIILACDGLWKAFKAQEALTFAEESRLRLEKETAEEDLSPGAREAKVWEGVCEDLAAEAVRKGCQDNVSVLIVLLHLSDGPS